MQITLADCETTGLPDYNLRARDVRQPHIVSLAALLCDDSGNILEQYEAIAKPDGWSIPPELTAIHGISNEHALKVGIPEKEILVKALAMIRAGQMFVAFNEMFDRFIIRCGLRRYDLMQDSEDAAWKSMPRRCAMKPMVNICKLPFPNGRKGWKYPRLQEAYKHAFGKEFEGAHNALADLLATRELYLWQKQQGLFDDKIA